MDRKIEEYYGWYEKEYAKAIDLSDASHQADKKQIAWLKKALKNFAFKFSSIWRYESLNTMRYYAITRKTEYICTAFKISRVYSKKKQMYNTTYAFLYSYLGKNNKLVHDFVCTCPTFKSADGEYRHRFIPYEQIMQVHKEFLKAYEPVEEHLIDQMKNGTISLTTHSLFTPGMDTAQEKQLKQSIDKNRLPIILYAAAWIVDYARLQEGKLENHLAEGYKEAMFSPDDEDFYRDWRRDNENEYIRLSLVLTRVRKEVKQNYLVTEIGQKFIPLTVAEVEDSQNIEYQAWREAYLSSQIGNLVINGISPSFPIFNDWFFIRSTNPALFDNKITHLKLQHSQRASGIVRGLEKARSGTYLLDPFKQEELYYSYNLENLSEAIELPMDFAEQQIVFSDITLCTLTEHVGRTLGDLPELLKRDPIAREVGPMFSDLAVFDKYLFEFFYAMFCMNKHYGLIHGDLHLNNATLFRVRNFHHYQTGELLVPNPHIVYNTEGQLYTFPHHGRTSCIIDFSRSLIGKEFLAHGTSSLVASEIERFLTRQQKSITRLMERDMPDFYKQNAAAIQIALLEHYDAVYRIVTLFDPLKLVGGFLNLCQQVQEPSRLKIYGDVDIIKNKIIPRLENIRDYLHHAITTSFLALFKKNPTLVKEGTWPILNLIEKFFKPYQAEHYMDSRSIENVTIVDYFSSQNTLKYDIRSYDKLPEPVRLDYVVKHKIPTEQVGLHNYELYQEYIKKSPPEDQIAKIALEVTEQKAERRGTPLHVTETKKDQTVRKEELQALKESQTYYYES